MRRLLGLAICLALAPGAAAAQTVDFALGLDSVLPILTGTTRTIQLQINGTGGVSAYNITVFLDRSRVDVAAADSVPGGYGLPAPTPIPGTDSVVLSASGTGSTYSTVPIANVTFSMGAAAAQGSLVSLRVNSLTLGDGVTSGLPGHRTGLLNICQATSVWGDVTGDRIVNSRDALVALTAAVGLSVPGTFDLSLGDVDGDQQVTSRDALLILSAGIGLSLPYGVRAGAPIPASCAPLAQAPDSLLFFRSGVLYGIAKGDTLLTPLALPLAPTTFYQPRWSPDGTRILYTAFTALYANTIVVTNGAGTVLDTLVRNASGWAVGADWAPDGTRIAYVSGVVSPNSVFVMNADGTNQTQVTTSPSVDIDQGVTWSPDGTRLAFVACQTCSSFGIWVVNVDGTGLTEVVPESAGQQPERPEWTSAGDSLCYYAGNAGYVRIASAAAGDTGRVAVRLPGNAYDPAPSRGGRGFRSTLHFPDDYFLRRASDGRYLRLVRGDASNSDSYFAFRRMGGVYVDTVTVTPASPDTVLVSLGSQQFTASVKNNDGSTSSAPITWSSSNLLKISVNASGLATLADTTTGTYVKASVGGWRSDSTLVVVIP